MEEEERKTLPQNFLCPFLMEQTNILQMSIEDAQNALTPTCDPSAGVQRKLTMIELFSGSATLTKVFRDKGFGSGSFHAVSVELKDENTVYDDKLLPPVLGDLE